MIKHFEYKISRKFILLQKNVYFVVIVFEIVKLKINQIIIEIISLHISDR